MMWGKREKVHVEYFMMNLHEDDEGNGKNSDSCIVWFVMLWSRPDKALRLNHTQKYPDWDTMNESLKYIMLTLKRMGGEYMSIGNFWVVPYTAQTRAMLADLSVFMEDPNYMLERLQ